MSNVRRKPVKGAPQRNTASNCRRGCGSTTLDMWTGRAGWQRQPCPALIIYSQQVGRRRHTLKLTHRTGIITVRLVFRCRRIHLPSPPPAAGQVRQLVGLQYPLSRSNSRRRTEMLRDQVQAAAFALRFSKCEVTDNRLIFFFNACEGLCRGSQYFRSLTSWPQ